MISHDVTVTSMRFLHAGQGNVTCIFWVFSNIAFVFYTGKENVLDSQHQLYIYFFEWHTKQFLI